MPHLRLSSQHVGRERSKVLAHFSKQDENSAQCSVCQKVVATKEGNTCNTTKYLQSTHGIKLKESGVFGCLNKVAKLSSAANISSTANVDQSDAAPSSVQPPAFVSGTASTSSSRGKNMTL